MRLKTSMAGALNDHFKNGNKRPHSLISVSSSSSSGSGFSSGYCSGLSAGFGAVATLSTTQESPLEMISTANPSPTSQNAACSSVASMHVTSTYNPMKLIGHGNYDCSSPWLFKRGLAVKSCRLFISAMEVSSDSFDMIPPQAFVSECQVPDVNPGRQTPTLTKEDACTQTTLKRPAKIQPLPESPCTSMEDAIITVEAVQSTVRYHSYFILLCYLPLFYFLIYIVNILVN